jgi:hypothetical protein
MNNLTNDSTGHSPPARSPDRHSPWWFWLAGAAGLVAIGYISTRVFGGVSGEEFSPDLVRRRQFSYYEIPLIHLQITPVHREDTSNSLEQHLTSQNLIQQTSVSEPRWDLVWARQGAQPPRQGDAGILCAYLDTYDSDRTLIWKDWSEKNPQLAKILWSTIGRLAQQRLYLLVPEVFSVAAPATEAEALRQSIAKTLADRYEQLARTHLELGDHQSARELAEEGLRHAPDRDDLKQVFEQSRSASSMQSDR